jgi:signal transduction histidine kinase/CheY-like chemotaxis protein
MTPDAGRRRRLPLTIRRLLGILLGIVGLLVGALFLVTSLQVRGSNFQATAENRRNQSFRLADSMRQSSNDLTHMVRLYVSTGMTRYREYYDEILAIRNGTAPRPVDYDSSFWDRVLAEGKASVRYGPPRSLVDQMRAADFTAGEFDALEASLMASNELAQLELEVMDRVAQRIAQGVDDTYFADVRPEYQRLVDAGYLSEKYVIMDAVGDFIDLVDQRTLDDVERVRKDNRELVAVQLGILTTIVLLSLASLAVVTRKVLRPLDRLVAATRRFADGEYGQRADIRSVSDLERLAAAFNEMAAAIQSDVARREQAEHAAVEARQVAEEATRAKSTFLAAMSHEIRTPLIGVTGMLEVLAHSGLDPQHRHMVGTAQSSARSLLQIIGDVLDFSKIEAGKLDIVHNTFVLRPLVEAAVATFFHTASSKGLLIAWSVDDDIAPAHVGDPLRIRQILSNFLSNAVKFTEVGGVEVSARVLEGSETAQTIEFRVTDTGPGVSADQQRQLFEEYKQAGLSSQQRASGTGLGLVICRRLAELMGGAVTMESTLGKGTTMRLTVPLPIGDPADADADGATPAGRRAPSRPKPSRAGAEREGSLVLLAEDHPVNRTVLSHQLDLIGFHVDTAADGTIALEMFRTGRYGLVLTDLNMPGLDGYELTAAIRAHEQAMGAGRTPILALSANVMLGEPERCIAAGMDDFVAKPTTIPFLGSKLRQWLPHLEWPAGPVQATVDPAEPTGGVDGTEPPVDSGALDELTGGDPELAASVLQDFVEASQADLRALDAALSAGDVEAVRRQAHRLKGASLLVGARPLARLAQDLESLAGNPSADSDELRRLAAELAAAQAVLVRTV